MTSYDKYVSQAERYVSRIIEGKIHTWKRSPLSLLNGQPWSELRKAVEVKELRKAGAFFTSHRLARLAVDLDQLPDLDPTRVIAIDPACGAGDLLPGRSSFGNEGDPP